MENGDAPMLRADLPRWEIWHGVSGLWYARLRKSSPPVVLKARTTLELTDRVLSYLGCPSPALRWAMVRYDSLAENWPQDADG